MAEERRDDEEDEGREEQVFTSFEEYAFPQAFSEKEYTSSKEFFSDLDAWLSQAYFWSSVTAAFPYYLLANQVAISSPDGQPPFPVPFNFPHQNLPEGQSSEVNQETEIDGIECRIPPLWKRVVAEIVDFLILFFLKLAMTFVAVDFLDLIDLDKFDLESFHRDSKIEYNLLVQVTHDIIILEIIHRIVVCIFETFWLQGGSGGRIGGATPGKNMLGLRVVKCETSTYLGAIGDETIVIVKPGTDLGLMVSLFRAVLKNIVLTFLIPAGFIFLYFRQNRTGYDIVCGTIVVEEPLSPHRRNHQD